MNRKFGFSLLLAIASGGVLTAQSAAAPKASAPAPAAPKQGAQQAGAGGFKVGDTVQINTLFGWANGTILAVRGNSYYVHAQTGADVWKDYPTEVRRIGGPNAEDHANGVYELHDRVQVNFEGKWVDSEVMTILGSDYQVTLPGNRLVWANRQQLRYVGPQVKAAAPKPGTPPKPGLTSCAGKVEGRYSAGSFGNFSVVFKGGKATLSMYGEGQEAECWTGGGKIYLRSPDPNLGDMVFEINNDGTLDSPMGELKKKGN
ncbi:MAG: hypothetical protein JWO19_2386 [Bryobacterales bacterium]|nr:hypothetical protein [Bryobacterales bacterium]